MIKVLEQAIEKVKTLSEERQRYAAEVLEQIAETAHDTVYATLSDAEKAEIDAAIDELDRGQGVSWDAIKSDLEVRIGTSRA